MAKVKISDIKTELLNFLRNSNVLTIAERGVATATNESHTPVSTGVQVITLTNTNVKNIRSVTKSGTLVYGIDYTYNLDAGTVTLLNATTDPYLFTYDYGNVDAIFPDFSLLQLKNVNFPRIAFDIVSGETTEISLGAVTNLSNYRIQINVYSDSQKTTDTIIEAVRSAIQGAKKSFYYIPFITPTSMGPEIISPWGNYKIFQRSQDCSAKFVVET